MNQTLRQWEGQVVDRKFPLLKYLGSSDHSIVFLTEREGPGAGRAAIKLVADVPEDRDTLLTLWTQAAASLRHAHLLQIFAAGSCRIGEVSLLYVVMEYAEENLAEVTDQRPLTFAEARETVTPLLSALDYLHGKGFIQGAIKPSNVMAVGDRVKLSSDTVQRVGELRREDSGSEPNSSAAPEMGNRPVTAAADIWSLGAMLRQVLPSNSTDAEALGGAGNLDSDELSDAFSDIIGHCLQPDPQQRWKIREIAERLDLSSTPSGHPALAPLSRDGARDSRPTGEDSSAKWIVVAFVAVAALILVVLLASKLRKPEVSQSPTGAYAPQLEAPQTPATASELPHAEPKQRKAGQLKTPSAATAAMANKPATGEDAAGAVRDQFLPDVSPSARRTIQGHIRVAVKVNVDASGNVVNATFQTRGPSEYFARHAMEAARRWKFFPPKVRGENIASQWLLRFAFGRKGTDVTSAQAPVTGN